MSFAKLSAMEEPNSERIITPMPKTLVSAIDDFRFLERMPSRAEAIRCLIEMGLAAAQQVAAESVKLQDQQP
jgi:metal-responsive CopG/Arc/MetJ family transcriptional regulator